jgi:ribonuclease P protein component
VATFPPPRRLHHKREFDSVYRQGKRVSGSHFLVIAIANNNEGARLGLSVSAKSVGNSVNRNRVKRIIRDSFRNAQTLLPPIDIVVNSKPAAKAATNEVLRQSLEQHWTDIARKCAR